MLCTRREVRAFLEASPTAKTATCSRKRPPASEHEAGLAAAQAALGEDRRLDREQREAFELLTGGVRWACLTGRAGTGKGPVLHAAAEAYRAAGWRVIACAMDGTTARRMAEQLGGKVPALTVEQLKSARRPARLSSTSAP